MRAVNHAAPSADAFMEGMRIAGGLIDLDGPNVNPLCRTRLYTHGHRTERALLLLHGFTNCPQQFDSLGKRFHDSGWNVLIPRYPRHGYSDRLSTTISELRSDHLVAVANQSATAAAGLGRHLTVAGLSLGGVLAGHLAQTHDSVERAVLIAPMFGLKGIPGPGMTALARLASLLPNFFIWWDPKFKDRRGPAYGYPRFATHAYAALFQIARGVLKGARKARPKAGHLAVITNAAEPRLDNRFTYLLVESWRSRGATVSTFEFPASDHLPHDLIDPANEEQNTELAYPVVMRAIEGQGEPAG
jgi:pimeloyl-ACP methyl ester carboxylesterase